MDKDQQQNKRVLPERKPCGCGKKRLITDKYTEPTTQNNLLNKPVEEKKTKTIKFL